MFILKVFRPWRVSRMIDLIERIPEKKVTSPELRFLGGRHSKYCRLLCMCSMYVFCACILCMYSVHVFCVCILCMYSMYVFHVCIPCMYSMYVCIPCMYSMYVVHACIPCIVICWFCIPRSPHFYKKVFFCPRRARLSL